MSTWTRKVAAPVVAAAAGMLLATGATGAAAQTASQKSSRLTFETARHLANQLRAQQEQQRSLIFAEIKHGRRISDNRIDFDYRDRSTKNVLCTARIVVVQTSSSRSADMRDASCHGIPSEDLSFETAGRHLADDVWAMHSDIEQSRAAFAAAVRRCDSVSIPRSRRGDVRVLFEVAEIHADFRLLRHRLEDFAQELHDYYPADPVLLDGIDAWNRLLGDIDEIPAVAASPCKAVKEWKANGWTDDSAPADFGTLRVIRDQYHVQGGILGRVANHLRYEGVRKRPAQAFKPSGLIALVSTP